VRAERSWPIDGWRRSWTRTTSFERAVGGGQAPTTAAEVLAAVPGPEGIAALVRALARTDEDEFLHIAALDTLAAIGEPAIEPLCAARTGFPPGSVERDTLTDAIALHPGPHPRIRDVLVEVLNEDLQHGAAPALGERGSEIVAILRALWDAYEVVESEEAVDENAAGALGHAGSAICMRRGPGGRGEVRAASSIGSRRVTTTTRRKRTSTRAIRGWAWWGRRRPGGVGSRRPSRRLSDALDEAGRLKRPDGTPWPTARRSSTTRRSTWCVREAPGRNDPCWCGSGKKYKKCHLDADGA
jgi:hypothetical protein